MKKEKTDFVKCQFCSTEIPSQSCELAAYFAVIDGKKYTFCCKTCAKEYERDKAK
jgi:YHS domain-containing protein